jgi:hypothetical protein
MQFEKYDDLFAYNRSLMEDDFNDGQFLVVKDKRKAGKHEFTTAIKIAEAKDGKHKLALEEKLKFNVEDFGGINGEAKWKNNGSFSSEIRSDFIKRYNGFKDVNSYMQSEVVNGGLKKLDFGIEHNN